MLRIAFSCLGNMNNFYFLLPAFLYFTNFLLQVELLLLLKEEIKMSLLFQKGEAKCSCREGRLRTGRKSRGAGSYRCHISLLASQHHIHRSRHRRVLGCISHGHKNTLNEKVPTHCQTSELCSMTHRSFTMKVHCSALNSPTWFQRIAVFNEELDSQEGQGSGRQNRAG